MPQSTAAAISGSTDEFPAAPRPGHLALRLLRCRQLRVIVKHWAGPCFVSVSLTLSEQRRNGWYRALGSRLKCGASRRQTPFKVRPPPSTAATMRARRMMDAMTSTELPATAMGPPHELRGRCLWPIRQEPFCLAIAMEDGQTEYILLCREHRQFGTKEH